tara:strand:- start:141 stop:545 length:405 start_codon:yes stop_codon:yes gene_type:complete
MPKQFFKISDFSGGINNSVGPKEISDSECVDMIGMIADSRGILKTAGEGVAHSTMVSSNKDIDTIDDSNGIAASGGSDAQFDCNLRNAAGLGLFYFETDHGTVAKSTGAVSMSAHQATISGTYGDQTKEPSSGE